MDTSSDCEDTIMRTYTVMVMVMVAATTLVTASANLEQAALELLTGQPIGPRNCFAANIDGELTVVGSNFTMSDIQAITNRADVLALAAAQDAAVAENVSDRAMMASNFVAHVQAEWGVAWTGSPAQMRSLRRRLIADARRAQAILDNEDKTAKERFAAIGTLKRLDAISGYYRELKGSE